MPKCWIVIIMLLISSSLLATHQRSGEITYRHVSGLTYDFTIVTYTFAPSPADRPELEIKWGDGTSSILPRVNGPAGFNPANIWVEHVGEIVGPNIRKNVYTGRKTFPGAATYVISLEDPNRNLGVINIPNSVDVPFYVEAILIINPLLGFNSSPQLLLPPIDNGCVGRPFLHNTGAYDPDGDSLSFKLIACKGAGGLNIPGYTLPQASNSLSINQVTGDLVWDSPTIQGEFNLAILIEEWRPNASQTQWIKVGSVTRDLQVIVGSCENNQNPPIIHPLPVFCVVAGDTIRFTVRATDIDNQIVTLTAAGVPLLLNNNPATFLQPVDSLFTVSSEFVWPTACSHVSKNPYNMFFKAQDNGNPVRLIGIRSTNIRVIGPPPQNLSAQPIGNRIELSWNAYSCSNAAYFNIYRASGSSGYVPGECITGVPSGIGYERIGKTDNISTITFTDFGGTAGLLQGIQYCYLITAVFPDGSEGYASNEACAALKKDVPVITNVSINSTSPTDGIIYVAWSRPTEIDYTQAPGPFSYIIQRSLASSFNFQPIDTLYSLEDTIYIDQPLITSVNSYQYRIDFYNETPGNRFFIGSSQRASSIRLEAAAADRRINLFWIAAIPWINDYYVIYRYNRLLQSFDSIGFTVANQFSDSGLVNGENYCYKVVSFGRYSAPGFVFPIINHSQELCSQPKDLSPPCPPVLSIETDCERLENILSWYNTNTFCPGTDDTEKYHIWYKPPGATDYFLLDSTNTATDTSFIHPLTSGIAGCYTVTAMDVNRNVSQFSNEVCVMNDACPLYTLPDVFTPNGDSYNDFWHPFPYSGVDRIELSVFNRWGKLVFYTTNPDVNWDGRNQFNNLPCSEGVYFYAGYVYEITLEGIRKRPIQGVVHIFR